MCVVGAQQSAGKETCRLVATFLESNTKTKIKLIIYAFNKHSNTIVA